MTGGGVEFVRRRYVPPEVITGNRYTTGGVRYYLRAPALWTDGTITEFAHAALRARFPRYAGRRRADVSIARMPGKGHAHVQVFVPKPRRKGKP